ncbi:MAG: EVE domain-containing protein [Parvibaculum sp.]|uniref:EVE domain-containing protein n=1 Tax=Parvibaculum sp. TaxID=2024848 RepID=UPI0025E00DB1|nr:EVE domain-containing protein [Parvibaculum sp.]MCE9648003.1 EVE domain-containing protein [Parvibaculum sp.]
MAYWLFKSEAHTWSWDQQKKKGAKGEPWTGVRNHQANNNMKLMKKGDLGFFYHSGDEKSIVGLVRVIGEHRPDPTDETKKFGLVVIEAVDDIPKQVTLAQVKAVPELREMMLVVNSRLSVQPVRDAEWKLICKMGGMTKAP